MESPPSTGDLLGLNKEPRLASLLHPKEKIVFSCDVEKFNSANKCQNRIILLTDSSFYNIMKCENFMRSVMTKIVGAQNKYLLKRQIPISKIEAITLSNHENSMEFVIHVVGEYDYRFRLGDRKTKNNLIKSICNQYERVTNSRLAFYFTDDITLVNKFTHKSEIKGHKKVQKYDVSPIYLNMQDLIDYELPGVKFSLLYSQDGKHIDISCFKSGRLEKISKDKKYFSIQKNSMEPEFVLELIKNQHPFISIPAYCFKTSGSLYLLRPLCIGGKMKKIIEKKGPYTKNLFIFYICQLILAIEHLHRKGWIYTSLSIDQIYIKCNGYICLEGMNRYMKPATEDKLQYHLCGAAKNMAPEMILCEGFNKSIDIWGIGLIAYQMLIGKHPFERGNKKETIDSIVKKKLRENEPNLPSFVVKSLEVCSKKRATLQEIKEDEWFKEVDWKKIEREEVTAPYLPEIKSMDEWFGKMPSIMYVDP